MSNYQVVDRCDFQPGNVISNQYTVKKMLGEGSFGVVYLVEDRTGSKYALKLLRLWEVPADIRKPLMDRFEMEFKTGQIDCDNLVRSLDFGTVGGNPFIVMEFCPGGDLEPLLGKSEAQAPRICQDILIGLNALHTQGKVHRDLKPENVLFKQNGKAALTDFGIAGDRTHRMTQRNIFGKPYQIFGTYAYMPPEQVNRARGNSTVLPTTDLFSFGVLMYQMVTGVLPFGTLEDENDLVRYQRRGKAGEWDRSRLLASPNGALWERLVSRCLVPELKDRIQTAKDAMALVPQYGSNYVKPAPAPAPTPRKEEYSGPAGTFLRIMQGMEHGTVYDLAAMLENSGRRLITVGRDDSNIIQLRDYSESYLSRRHFTLEKHASGEWMIRDGQWDPEKRVWTDSTNGTYVNSTQVTRDGVQLKKGDIVTAGDIKLRFETNFNTF